MAPQGDQLCLRGFEAGVWRLREVAWDLELDVYKTTRALLRCIMIHDCTQGLSDNEEIQSVFHSTKYHRGCGAIVSKVHLRHFNEGSKDGVFDIWSCFTLLQVVLPFVPMFHVLSWGTPFALLMYGDLANWDPSLGTSK